MNVDTFYFITLIDKYNKILTQSEITDFINEISDFTDNNSIDNVFARMSYNHIHENIETGYVNTVIDCSICKFKEDNAVEIIENGVIPKLEDAYLENIFTVFLWNKYQINNDIDVDVYCYGNIPITSAFGNYGQMFYIWGINVKKNILLFFMFYRKTSILLFFILSIINVIRNIVWVIWKYKTMFQIPI